MYGVIKYANALIIPGMMKRSIHRYKNNTIQHMPPNLRPTLYFRLVKGSEYVMG